MARRHVKRANPPRWTREGRLLRKKLNRGTENSAPAPEPKVAPAAAKPVTDSPSIVEVQVEDSAAEVSQELPATEAAKKPVRRRRRRSKSSLDEK